MVQREKDPEGNTSERVFCSLPFVHSCLFLNGRVLPCCVGQEVAQLKPESSLDDAINSPKLVSLRKKMVEGGEPEECSRCYSQFKRQKYSHRDFELERQAILTNSEAPLRIDAKHSLCAADIRSIELRFDSTCPRACAMCGSSDSSKWSALLKRAVDDPVHTPMHLGEETDVTSVWLRNNILSKPQNFTELRHIQIAGGEPFASRLHLPFLEKLVETGMAENITLEYITSGTVSPINYLPLFRRFRRVIFMISFDGIDAVNKYIRFPAKTNDVFDFVDELLTGELGAGLEVHFECTVQALNVLTIPEFLSEILDWSSRETRKLQNLGTQPSIGFHMLRVPEPLALSALPSWYLEEAKAKLASVSDAIPEGLFALGRRRIPDLIREIEDSMPGSSGRDLFAHLDYLDRVRGTNRMEAFVDDPYLGSTVEGHSEDSKKL